MVLFLMHSEKLSPLGAHHAEFRLPVVRCFDLDGDDRQPSIKGLGLAHCRNAS